MGDALDNIFSVIMESEMIAQVGKQKQKEAKDAIERVTARLKKQESQKELHMAKKSQLELAVAETSIAIKVLKVKEETVTNELRALEKNVGTEKNKHDDASQKIIVEYERFIGRVKSFSMDYGLTSSGTERRVHSAKERLRSSEGDRERLGSDVDELKLNNDGLRMILDEKSKEKTELIAITGKIDGIDTEIDNGVSCAKELENTISQLIIEPDYGPAFMSVKGEIHAYEVTNLEAEVDKLKKELTSLTRKLQKKEAQSLRLQYRLWQRQQQHQNKSTDNLQQLENQATLGLSAAFNKSDSDTDLFRDDDIITISDEDIKIETS